MTRPNDKFTFSIIGLGRLGKTLAKQLNLVGGDCQYLISRRAKQIIINDFPIESTFPYSRLNEIKSLGQYCFICVPDDHIQTTADLILKSNIDLSGTDFIHTSGTKNSSILDNLKEKGLKTCSFHPMQTFTGDDANDVFKNILVSIEGQSELSSKLFQIAYQLGSKPLIVSKRDKMTLHISGVILANFISALVIEAKKILSTLEVPTDEFIRDIYGPLMLNTLNNILKRGVKDALTGPAARGDQETLMDHKLFLQNNGYSSEVYDILTRTISDYMNVSDVNR
jgi:predicted short-subunit dehydrogenase-like oxidoreductase (DUF2520 family)